MATFRKDLVSENDHPLNLVEGEATDESSVTRPPIFEVYMRMAEELAKRSTCARLKVGTVITDRYLEIRGRHRLQRERTTLSERM